jgi:monoamine oxidase
MALLRESGEATVHIGESPEDIWEAAQRILQRVDLNGPDSSVDAFLRRVDTPDAELARMLIEGFDAAIATDASVIAIAKEWRGHANDTQFRPANGYGAMMEFLAHFVKERLWLNAPVQELRWSSEGVEVRAVRDGEPVMVRAARAIVTLPIGVLRENEVRFTPQLPAEKRAAIDAIGMGPVVKVVLEFRSVFWDESFYRTPPGSPFFPTVWSRLPQRAPLLVAWAGGDCANRLIAAHADPIAAAVDVCAQLFPAIDIRAQLVDAHCHDWQRDSYARGAYSYLRVNADGARRGLAEPVDGVLFFAGEATSESDAGTVAGALDSGYLAAAQVLALSGR